MNPYMPNIKKFWCCLIKCRQFLKGKNDKMVDTNELSWLKFMISYTYYNGPIVNNRYHECCCDPTFRLATKI
jgi:hypothetical protein